LHVVATAGHVDHGKSTLVKELTGTDPDRLLEEKQRGLTIDLGFAWLDLPSAGRVSIVDVPGHERFIRNMLAGVGSVDAVIFVVAATEGWKPQSQEHLDILDLLGVTSGVIAITRSAEVSAEQLGAVKSEVRSKLASTSLSGAPIVNVAAIEGIGLEAMRSALDESLTSKPLRKDVGRPRLWVDRVFTMKGSGTVVTGTLTDGWIRNDDEVEILPAGKKARVRGLQSQKRLVAEAPPGSRLAVNLTGIGIEEVERGDVITTPGRWRVSRSFMAKVRLLHGLAPDLLRKGAFKLHIGSVALDAELRAIGEAFVGGEGPVFIKVSGPIPIQSFDRFVIRESGRRITVGGGMVLDPDGASLPLKTKDLLASYVAREGADTPARMLRVILDDGPLPTDRALARAGEAMGAEPPDGVTAVDGMLVNQEQLDSLSAKIEEQVDIHHRASPMETGLSITALRERLPDVLLDAAIALLRAKGSVVIEGGHVRRTSHTPRSLTQEAQEVMALLEESGSTPPSIPELRTLFGPALIGSLEREGKAVRVSDELLFSATWLNEMQTALRDHVSQNGAFTVAEFRDLIGTSRKFAVPLLEYLDRKRITLRDGDHRTVGPAA